MFRDYSNSVAHGSRIGKIMQGAWPQSIGCGNLPSYSYQRILTSQILSVRVQPGAMMIAHLDHQPVKISWKTTSYTGKHRVSVVQRRHGRDRDVSPPHRRQLSATHRDGYRLYLWSGIPPVNHSRLWLSTLCF